MAKKKKGIYIHTHIRKHSVKETIEKQMLSYFAAEKYS